MDLEDLISQADAAELRGVSRASINELVKRGRLRTAEIGGKIFLYRSEVESFEPQPGGRPPKAKAEPATAEGGGRKFRRVSPDRVASAGDLVPENTTVRGARKGAKKGGKK